METNDASAENTYCSIEETGALVTKLQFKFNFNVGVL